jgi:hypothetical protein
MTSPFDVTLISAGGSGAPTNAPTTVHTVLSRHARVSVTVRAASVNFTKANPGTPVFYPTGVNIGPMGFANN